MNVVFAEHGTSCDDFIVAPGRAGAVGHDMGSGPIRAGTPVVIDIWPRDNTSYVYCDMTRTFVVGDVPSRRPRLASPLQGGARPRDLRDQGRREREGHLRRHLRDLRGGGRGDAAHEGGRGPARGRVLPRPRSRRRARGARGARARVDHRVASSAGDVVTVEPGLYRRAMAACGSRTSCSSRTTAPRTSRTTRTTSGRDDATDRHDVPRGAAVSALGRIRRTGERAAGRSTTRTSRSSGGASARAGHVVRAVLDVVRVGAAVREVVPRRQAERLRTTASTGTSRRGAAAKVAYHWEGEPDGERRDDHLRGTSA